MIKLPTFYICVFLLNEAKAPPKKSGGLFSLNLTEQDK